MILRDIYIYCGYVFLSIFLGIRRSRLRSGLHFSFILLRLNLANLLSKLLALRKVSFVKSTLAPLVREDLINLVIYIGKINNK